MKYVKRGETLEFVIEFTPEEWVTLYPFDSIESKVQTGSDIVYELDVSVNNENRLVTSSADTSSWIIGTYKCDILIVKNERKVYLPINDYVRFEIVKSVSGEN